MTHAELLERLERCFDPGEIETRIFRDSGAGVRISGPSAAVKIIHRPSGLEAESDQYPTQVRNKTTALLVLLQLLHESAA